MKVNRLKLILILLFYLFSVQTVIAQEKTLPPSSPSFPITFDSAALAAAETNSWRSYYEKNFSMLFQSIVEMLHQQFHLSMLDSIAVGTNAVKAARAFSRLPRKTTKQQYQEKVLPYLITFYTQLKDIFGGDWDPNEVAEAELNWWVARRTPGKNSPKQVGTEIAQMYQLLYGKNNPEIQKAGLLRAEAAHLRDVASRRGKIPWSKIQKLLTQSYDALLKGIALNNSSPKKQNIAK